MKRLITSFASLLLFGTTLFGCSEDEPTGSITSDAGLNIPAHLQGIENLTIYPADVEPTHDIDISFDLTYDEIENYTNQRIRVDDQDRLFVGRHTIQVYDSDGSWITEMGGVGQGPGEFAGFSQVNAQISDSRLFGIDDINSRINYFSLETLAPSGALLLDPAKWRQIDVLVSSNIYPQYYFTINDSTLLVGFTERLPFDDVPNEENRFNFGYRDIRFFKMNLDGQILSDQVTSLDETHYCPSGEVRICFQLPFPLVPQFPHSVLVVNNSGQILKADTDEVMLQILDSDGNYLKSFYHPGQRVKFDVHQLFFAQDENEDIQAMENLPNHWPAFKNLLIDDEDRIWLSLFTEDESSLHWRILDSDGNLLATFDWTGSPYKSAGYRDTGIKAVKNGFIYSYELLDEEHQEGQLSRHRFTLTQR